MNDPTSERRLAENEVFFRGSNERVAKSIEETRRQADAKNEHTMIPDPELAILFYCECSDENCLQRIKLTPAEYSEHHENSDHFIILPGHDVPEIEKTVLVTDEFIVVEKYMSTPQSSEKLNPTDIDNTER